MDTANKNNRIHFKFAATILSRKILTCIIKKRNGATVDRKEETPTIGDTQLDFSNAIFDEGAQVFKLICTFKDTPNSAPVATLMNYLVVMSSKLFFSSKLLRVLYFLILVGTVKIEEIKPGQYIDQLQCKMDPEPSDDFIPSYAWTKDGAPLSVRKENCYANQ